MLTLIRNAARRPAAVLSKQTLARYTTNDSEWGIVAGAFAELSAEQQPGSITAGSRSRRQPSKWKPFKPNSFVRPYDMTYEARLVVPKRPTRRPVVGPSPSVARYTDIFHQFCIDPVSQAQNPQMLAPFLSDMGKIYGRNVTGLTSRSQRRLGKAIRRAKMMGVIPILSKPTSGIFYGSPKRLVQGSTPTRHGPF